MVCVQCGNDNPEHAKYCTKCSALLFQVAPEGPTTSSTLNIDEEFKPPMAETHYQSPLLEQLAWAVHDFVEEDGELEPVIETYEAYREVYEAFQREMPALREMHYTSQEFFSEDPNHKYVTYLLDQAVSNYTKGETLFESYLEALEAMGDDEEGYPDPEPLKEGTRNWLNCNDNICMTFELIANQYESLSQALEEYEEEVAAGVPNPTGGRPRTEEPVEEGAEAEA